MTRRLLIAVAAAVAFPVQTAAQTRQLPIRQPGAPKIEIAAGAGITGGLALGARDASLRSNSVNPTPFRLFASETRLEPAPLVEVRLGFHATSRLTVEGTLGVARPDLTSSLTADAESAPAVEAITTLTEYVITGGALWRFSADPRRRWTPFASGGAGVVRHVYEGNALIESGVDAYAGGGVLYALGRRAGLRFDGRVHVVRGGVAEGQGALPRGALTGSIFVAF